MNYDENLIKEWLYILKENIDSKSGSFANLL